MIPNSTCALTFLSRRIKIWALKLPVKELKVLLKQFFFQVPDDEDELVLQSRGSNNFQFETGDTTFLKMSPGNNLFFSP